MTQEPAFHLGKFYDLALRRGMEAREREVRRERAQVEAGHVQVRSEIDKQKRPDAHSTPEEVWELHTAHMHLKHQERLLAGEIRRLDLEISRLRQEGKHQEDAFIFMYAACPEEKKVATKIGPHAWSRSEDDGHWHEVDCTKLDQLPKFEWPAFLTHS